MEKAPLVQRVLDRLAGFDHEIEWQLARQDAREEALESVRQLESELTQPETAALIQSVSPERNTKKLSSGQPATGDRLHQHVDSVGRNQYKMASSGSDIMMCDGHVEMSHPIWRYVKLAAWANWWVWMIASIALFFAYDWTGWFIVAGVAVAVSVVSVRFARSLTSQDLLAIVQVLASIRGRERNGTNSKGGGPSNGSG